MFKFAEKEFDEPEISRWNHKEWKEGRNKFVEIWIDSYEKVDVAICRMSHCLLMKNGSVITLDGKRLRDKDFLEAKKVFEVADEGKRRD